MGLTGMLQQARNFVHSSSGANEFLILKFDKCTNWGLIADTCVDVLGLALYKGGGNLNTKTLEELRGKVVVLFSSKGLAESSSRASARHPRLQEPVGRRPDVRR